MKNLKRYTLIAIIVVSVVGSLWHFIYDFSAQNLLVGFFAPVNESTWEHMKLIFFPMLIFVLMTYKGLSKEYECILPSMLIGNICATWLIPVVFYTYSGIIGKNTLILDILTFVLCVICGFLTGYKLTVSCRGGKYKTAIFIFTVLMCACFFVFTIYPPHIGLFVSP